MVPSSFSRNLLGLLFVLLTTFVAAQSTQPNEGFTEIVETYTNVLPRSSTSPDGREYEGMATIVRTITMYGRRSTVRLLTQTDDQGQTRIYAEVTTYSSGGETTTSISEVGRTSTTIAGPTAEHSDPTIKGSPSSTLSIAAVAGISVGATSVVVAMAVGAYLVWRRRRGIKNMPATIKTHEEKLEQSTVYPKVELHATERALYEMDGQDVVPRIDGAERMASGELEDSHSSGVAREREGRSELQVGERRNGPMGRNT